MTKSTPNYIFSAGPMGTGKSRYLLLLPRLDTQVMTLCFAPQMDNSKTCIRSGNLIALARGLTPFTSNHDASKNLLDSVTQLTKLFFEDYDSPQYRIVIDECQFLAKSTIDSLLEIFDRLQAYDRLHSVYIAGLDTDVAGRPFPATQYLLANLDGIEIVTPRQIPCAICRINTATKNSRILSEVDNLVIISKDGYQAVCDSCFSPAHVVDNIQWELT